MFTAWLRQQLYSYLTNWKPFQAATKQNYLEHPVARTYNPQQRNAIIHNSVKRDTPKLPCTKCGFCYGFWSFLFWIFSWKILDWLFILFTSFKNRRLKGGASTVALDKTALCIDIASYIKETSQFIFLFFFLFFFYTWQHAVKSNEKCYIRCIEISGLMLNCYVFHECDCWISTFGTYYSDYLEATVNEYSIA